MNSLVWVIDSDMGQKRLHWKQEGLDRWYDVFGDADDATEEELADFLDSEAESDNYHHLAGVHDALRKVLLQKGLSKEQIRIVFSTIVEHGGLYGWRF